MYGFNPLFPPGQQEASSLRMPLFEGGAQGCGCRDCQTVRLCNPACREEYADVELCVDAAGCLSICVHRPPRPCLPPRPCRRKGCCDRPIWTR